ncbi:hypothetical protein DESC_610236 [Desulfosarcina cetonica]|nr:hypothetical protein DESC_610236 [Desulfosarcina cetonica]
MSVLIAEARAWKKSVEDRKGGRDEKNYFGDIDAGMFCYAEPG